MTQPFVSACFAERIGETIDAIQPLPPVVRSCHIGNNPANNWAWLALAGNTRHVQYDHTCYGVDELSAPWTVMGNHGYIERCIDHRGQEAPEAVGEHINDHVARFGVRYSAHLNIGVFAREGDDLVAAHFATAQTLAAQVNGSAASSDTMEVGRAAALLRAVVADLARADALASVFDRWVRTTGRGYTLIEPIGGITRRGDEVEIVNAQGTPFFRGSVNALLDQLEAGAAGVARRLESGRRFDALGYPWFALPFGYLVPVLEEAAARPERRRFWHGGGSASCYYIRAPELQASFGRLRDLLAGTGHLPPDAALTMIPTFVAQLFATGAGGLAALDGMLGSWTRILRSHPSATSAAVRAMSAGEAPDGIAARFLAGMDAAGREALRRALDAFNAADDHSLPIAHLGHLRHPTYNTSGLPQRALAGRRMEFPRALPELAWGEAELLCRVLAELTRDVRPPPDPGAPGDGAAAPAGQRDSGARER